ncbi:hypothetical protein BaRGS_00000034 [Batillaria attramentaria]|uniref:Uncharacterized protein n=1 Tax=Batillaria attramentaria TaxID=370345 RepID=A0ABD0MAF8_9CAEN
MHESAYALFAGLYLIAAVRIACGCSVWMLTEALDLQRRSFSVEHAAKLGCLRRENDLGLMLPNVIVFRSATEWLDYYFVSFYVPWINSSGSAHYHRDWGDLSMDGRKKNFLGPLLRFIHISSTDTAGVL